MLVALRLQRCRRYVLLAFANNAPDSSASQDNLDCIDLSENEIPRLENFPVMRRLGTLLLAHNVVSRCSSGLGRALPKLHTLVLSQNRLSSFVELDALAGLANLRRLSLVGNPVARKPHYRTYVVFRFPQLRELDFARVRDAERVAAVKWGASAAARPLLRELDALRAATHPEITSLPSLLGRQAVRSAGAGTGVGSSATANAGGGAGGANDATVVPTTTAGFTDEEKAAIEIALSRAETTEEFGELERYLQEQRLPPQAEAVLRERRAGGAARAVSDAPIPVR